MAYTDEEISAVWHKCDGGCVYGLRKKVSLSDYGITWEIDHANPYGVDDMRNWLVACIKHNRQKQDRTRAEFERWLDEHWIEKQCGW